MPAKSKKQIFKEDPVQIVSDNDIEGVSDEDTPVVKPVKVKKTRVKKASVKPVVSQSDDELVKVKKTKTKEINIPVVVDIKKKRAPSAYNLFIQEKMKDEDVKAMEPKLRFAHISKIYKARKEAASKK